MKKIYILFIFLFLSQAGCNFSDPEMMELLREIKAQNDKLLQEVEEIRGQLSLLDGRYQVILASLADNKEELELLKSQIDVLKAQITQQLIKIDELSAQLTQQGADIVKLSAEIAELKASCEELKGLMEELLAGKSSVPTDGLIAWYPFNGNANDESGNENNGTVNGATLTSDRFGNENRAYNFNGSSNIVFKPIEYENGFTVSYWVKSVLAKSGMVIVQNDPIDSRYRSFSSRFGKDNNRPSEDINYSRGREDNICNPSNIHVDNWGISYPNSDFVGNWTHVVGVTLSNGSIQLYINGEIKSERSNDNGFPRCIGPNSSLRVGGPWWNNDPIFYRGNIDDIAIWNRALTSEEISKMYKGEKF